MPGYFALLDVLRFLAAFFVMTYHYFSGSLHGGLNLFEYLVRYGALGVELFFIISGFVIYYSVQKPLKEYALGRFLRLYPLFWFIATLTYIFTVIYPGGNPLSFPLYLYNLLIVNTGKVAYMIDGSYWTLTQEIIFYIAIGIWVKLFTIKRLELFYILALLTSFITFYFGLQDLLVTKLMLTRYMPYFAFGGLLALYIQKQNKTKAFQIRVVSLLVFASLLPYYISYCLEKAVLNGKVFSNRFGLFEDPAKYIILGIFVAVPLAVYFSKYITNKNIIKITKSLGGTTYPLYLLHQKIGYLIIGSFAVYGVVSSASVLTTAGMIAVSFYIYLYEEKYRNRLNKYLKVKLYK